MIFENAGVSFVWFRIGTPVDSTPSRNSPAQNTVAVDLSIEQSPTGTACDGASRRSTATTAAASCVRVVIKVTESIEKYRLVTDLGRIGRFAKQNARRNSFWRVASAPESLDGSGKLG